MAKQRPTQEARGNEQQRKDRGDDARRDVPLGEIDRVEVDAELREPEERRSEKPASAEPQTIAFPPGD